MSQMMLFIKFLKRSLSIGLIILGLWKGQSLATIWNVGWKLYFPGEDGVSVLPIGHDSNPADTQSYNLIFFKLKIGSLQTQQQQHQQSQEF